MGHYAAYLLRVGREAEAQEAIAKDQTSHNSISLPPSNVLEGSTGDSRAAQVTESMFKTRTI